MVFQFLSSCFCHIQIAEFFFKAKKSSFERLATTPVVPLLNDFLKYQTIKSIQKTIIFLNSFI